MTRMTCAQLVADFDEATRGRYRVLVRLLARTTTRKKRT